MDWGEKASALEEAKRELLLAISILKRGAIDPYVKVEAIEFGGDKLTDGYEGVLIEEMVKSKQLMRLSDLEHSRLQPNFRKLFDEPVVALTTVGIADLEHELEVKDSHLSRILLGYETPKFLTRPIPATWTSRRAPAADRIVPLNHNSPEYQDAAKLLDELHGIVLAQVNVGSNSGEDSRLVRSLAAAVELWSAAELKITQIRIGVILAIEDARAFLTKIGEEVRIGILVDLIKNYVKSIIDADI